MSDFLLELLSQEIPARMQEQACADLARLFAAEIAKAGLNAAAIETFATPRRLALIARGLPAATEAVASETKGPRASAPPQALEGFLRKTGLARDALVERDGVLFAIVQRPGRATADVLAKAIPAIVRAFPWPKSMRWGAASASTASLRWVRPLQGIVALLGEEIVPFAVDGIASGATTHGHRFHYPGPITIGSADDYAAKLRACHVILDACERRGIIEDGARALAEARGLRVVPDAGLVAENAGLTEWPVPLLGDFDPAFLDVPREVIQLTMRTNQKYFACVDHEGRLAPNFICTANIAASDGGAGIVAGNRKVLAARLADARFFWEQDGKVPLAEQAKKLDRIVFHEKLGTVADKVERVAKLARWLVEEGIVPPRSPAQAGFQGLARGEDREGARLDPGLRRETDGDRPHIADMAEQAARLCKADLVTSMVGEFPELQGIMGGYYAQAEGLPQEVADAIRDHYKPVGQGDEVPTAPVTVAVSLADKIDSIVGFFGAKERPTGSRDPFALRRAALGVIQMVLVNDLRIEIGDLVGRAILRFVDNRFYRNMPDLEFDDSSKWLNEFDAGNLVVFDIPEFLADRLKVQQREAGVRHDLIDAVFALGGEDDLVRLLARVKALQAFVTTEDGANLLAGYKRAANILRKEGWEPTPSPSLRLRGEGRGEGESDAGKLGDAGGTSPLPTLSPEGERALGPLENRISSDTTPPYTPEPEEAELIAALNHAEPAAAHAVAAEDFAGAMAALAALRGPIDAFFERVTVNDPDPARRAARLGLLARVRAAVHRVADFSRIEG